MRRTNIYLEEAQTAALDTLAAAQGLSRAELVRRFVDHGVSSLPADLEADLAAIEESFGACAHEAAFERAPDERAAHLDRVARA